MRGLSSLAQQPLMKSVRVMQKGLFLDIKFLVSLLVGDTSGISTQME
jgi:hypothetical protein